MSADPTLESFFQDTFIKTVLGDVAEHTRYKYRASVRHANDFAKQKVCLSELCDEFIGALSNHLTKGGMSADQVRTHRQHLRTIAAEAQQRGFKTGWISTLDPLANNVGGNRRQKFKRDTRGPKAKVARQLAKAAAMYANGFPLDEIAAKLEVPKETIHTWKTRYRAIWNSSYERATQVVVKNVRAEAGKRADAIRRSAFLQRATAADAAMRREGKDLAVDDGDAGAGKSVAELLVDLNLSRGWGVDTYRQYRGTLRRVEQWSCRTLYCRDFAPEWVNKLLAELEASHLAPATVVSLRTNLLSMWRAANDAELCPFEPRKIRPAKRMQKPPSAWLYDEVQCAVRAAAVAPGAYEIVDPDTQEALTVPRAVLLQLAIRILWDTGVRPGDAMKLMMRDVQQDGLIRLTQSKTGRWHVVKLHASTLVLARSIVRSSPETRLIPWGKSYEYLRREFAEHVTKPAGLLGTLKTLRKASATDVELNYPGMGAVHLGHRLSTSIAHSHYLDPRVAFKNRGMPTELTADLQQAQSA